MAKNGINSRAKGMRFELAMAKAFSEATGLIIRRTPLSGGWARGNPGVAGDLVCIDPGPEAFPYCVECKNVKGWKLESIIAEDCAMFLDWWRQANEECPDSKQPLLVFTRNYIQTFVAFYHEFEYPLEFPGNYALVGVDGGNAVTVLTLKSFLEWRFQDGV